MSDAELLQYLEGYLTERRKARFMEVLAQRTRHFTFAIEDVYQLHNTSAVVRSCDVFGIQDLHVIEQTNKDRLDREIAMGAQKWIDVFKHDSAEACIKAMRLKGYQLVATSPHTEGVPLVDFDISKKSCFFIGKEKEGLSDAVLQQADLHLRIPMYGLTESLNLSVSAAIIMHALTTRLRASDVKWKLSDEEILDLRLEWCKRSIKSIDTILERYYKTS